LYRAGFNALPADKGKDSIKKGIDTIKSKQLYVISDSGDLLKELQTYVWSKDKNQNRLDMPVKFFDDACDAMRYAVYTHTLNRPNKLKIVFPK
jgi:phage terminase large subunit